MGPRLHESFAILFMVPSFAIVIALNPGGSGRRWVPSGHCHVSCCMEPLVRLSSEICRASSPEWAPVHQQVNCTEWEITGKENTSSHRLTIVLKKKKLEKGAPVCGKRHGSVLRSSPLPLHP